MNKIYKVIWNATLLAWVAVSELAKGKTKSSKVTGIIGAATVSLMVTFSPDVIANTIDMQPQGTRNDTDCVSAGNTTVYKAQTNGTTAPITDGSGTYSTVAGCNASGGGVLAATVYGSHSKVTGKGGTAVGHNNEAAQWALAAGVDSKATGESSIALGAGAAASNTSSIAIGTDSGASGSGALALMAGSKANAISSIAIGQTSSTGAAAEGSIAIGRNAQTSASGSIAIGDGATATGGTTDINSIAIGKGAQSWGQSFALGTGASADSLTFDVNDSGVAVGAQSVTAAGTTKGTAIGVNSKVTGSTVAGTAIGSNAVASIDNSVALGSNSTTSAITGTGFLTSQAAPTVGAVSVGNGTAAGNRRIQNVADGSAASDAVTVAQLDKAYDDTNGRLATVLGAGSGAAYNATNNTYTAPTNIGGTGKTTIDDAIKATQRSVVAGSNIVITPTTAADGSISYSVATSATPTFTSVTVNNAPTAGTDATNKTYVDSKAAASKTEVTAGTNVSGVAKTTGANGQDVYTVNANGTTASAGSSAVTVTAGTKNASNVTDYKVDLSTATKTDIQKGVDAKTAVDSTGLTFKGDTTATSATKKLGDTVSITGDTNISTVATTDGVQVKLNPNLNLGTTGSVTTGATVINNAGITANKVTINNAPTAGTDATNKTYVDSKAAASRTEVAAGSNVSGVVKTTGANGQDVYTVNANGTTASAGSSAVTVTPGTKDANNVTDYKVDLSATTKTDIQKGVDAKTAVDSTGLKFKGDTATTSATKKLGDTVSITGDTNISTVATTDGVQVKLNPNLDLGTAGSVKTGNTTINNAGVTANKVTINNAPTAGTDATNKTYVDSKAAASRTEVAAGSNVSGVVKTTGANGQDVYTVNANGTTASAGSSAVTVTPGTKDANNVTDYKVDLSATTKTDIQKGVDAKTAVDTTGLKFKGDTATTSNTKKLGDTVSITGDTNISTVATTDGVQVKLNPNLDLGATGSVKTGNTTINNAGVTADQVTVGGVVINNTSGINAGGKAITNVAAPTNNTDAANKKYVDDAGAALTNLGFGLKAQDGTTVNKKLGEAVDIVGSNSNISTKVNAGKVEVALSNTLDLGTTGSITTGSTVINNAGVTANKVTINNAPTAGTDATNKTYVDSKAAASRTEVAAGSNVSGVVKTTGANGQDVYTVNANGTTASAGSSAVTVTPGTKDANNVTDYKVDLSATTKTDIQKGVDAKTAVDTTGLKFKGDTATTSNTKKLGDTVSITGDTNISTVATTDGVQVKLNPNLDLGATGSVKTGNTTINNAGVTADQVTVGGVVINNTSGINAGGKAITNVAAPTNNTDAANKKYVDDAGTALTNLGFGLKAQDGTTVNKKLGEAVEVVGADSNITTKVAGGQVAIELNKNLNNLTGITVNDGTNGTNGSTVIGKDGISVKDGSGNTIAGVDNTALTVKDGSGNTETSINQAINTLNAAQGETDKFAVKYDKNADGSVNYNNVTLAGTNGTTISNVKAGAVTSTSTDAINGSQLYGVANSVKNAIGGSTTIDATTGAITTTNIGGTGSNTIDGAISSIKDSATKAKTTVSAGDNVVVTSGTNADGSTNYEVATAKDVNFDKVTVGSVVVDKSSNTIKGLSNTTWNGTAVSGQAATEDQLKTVSDAQGETDKFAVKYDKNADGSANYNNITLAGTTASSTQDATTGKITTTGGTSLNNVASAGDYKDVANASKGVNAGDLNNAVVDATNAATSKGFALQAADGAKVQKNLGEAVEVVGADSNITTKVVGGQVAIELNKNLNNLTGITVNDGTNGTNGSTVIGKDGISVKDGSGNTIAGVDNTALTVKDSSGNTETSINQAINTLNAAQGETDKFAVKYDKNADGSVNYNNVTLAGTNGTIIRNVKAGAVTSTSTDAINGSQLYDIANSVKNAIGGSTTRDVTTGAITTTNIGGTGSNTIDGAISSIKDSATKAKTTISAGDNVVVTSGTNADGSTNYEVATAKDVNFDKVTVGNVVVDKANDTIQGLSNKDLNSSDFATKGRAATEEQLKAVITSNITEVVDGNGNKVNIIDQVVNTKPDNKNQDSLFLTYDKQGQETTDRLTIGQTVQKMNTDGIKFFHTNADTSKGDLGTTNDSSAGGLNSTAIGVNAIVANGADSSVALGHNTKVNGKQSIAIGSGAEALGNQSISIGTGNKVTGDHSGAIGDPTIVNGANSYSVGNNNQVLTDDTFVLGNNVTKTVAGSVVLGNGSAATTGAGEAGYALSVATNADKAAINKTTSSTGAVAVGDASSGIYRQITGVAAGSVDSDAVNVAQLKAVGNQVVTTQTTLVNSLGGNAKVNADGTITGPTYNVAQGNQTNVGDALTALDNAINTAATTSKSTVSNGQNIVVSKSKNADGSDNYEVSTAKDLTVDSVKAGDTVLNNAGITIGNNAVVLNNTGLTISGGPSVTLAGINAGNKTIQNVANAVNATDAVNKGQLDSAINNVNNNVNELANNAVKYDDASKDKITLGGGTTGTTITNVKDGTVAQGSKDAVNGGQLWNVQQQVDQNTTDISNIKNDINNGTVGLVQQAGKDAPVTVAKDTGGTTVNVAGTDGNRVVTGVKEGAVNATSKDAVNGSQLNTTNQAVVNYLGGGAGYDNITGSFTAPSYTVGDSKYNNVGGAIDALNQADQALNSKIDNVSNKLDNAFRITNNRIDDVEKKANAGIAAAMALESAPYVPGKYTYAAGAAYHGGENAVGVTLRKTADNGRWSITGGVAAASQGDASVRIGISGVID
ncbi:ESPR-type extended signal peptide-containing protein [Acinetobacter bereziniae]|uniref:ESPR-type extended signal peptide-containing protein n=1 Tax=Acinetobacter bereziniae TaxID=106648 RepID=UPI0005A91AEB|nr:ESPR-type extended signal peptide-containing protein [Acinetobacter bereziniae]